ncbi:MAG TPA: TetR/AcrR family transcriptional regulator, partial [Acidimicrobiales bacterium]|nr:TetR/AcrR family transcriptional regulator [Acidimicrobiales bacterium]
MTSPPTTRNHILQVAAALFNQRGFNGTSMADLAAAVGVTKSSLYHHFPSKQSLLSEIIDLTVNRVTPLLREVAESDLPVVERLHRAIRQHTLEGIRDQDAQACFMEEGRYLAPDFMAAHVALRDRYEFIFRNMFEEGIASGDFLDRDISLTVKAVLGMCNSAVRWYQP